MRYAIAVDGGNSKTDLALVREDGELLALERGGGSSPHLLGLRGALSVIQGLVDDAREDAELDAPAALAQLMLSGVDFPAEEVAIRQALEGRAWAERIVVDNDTFAVLRAGTDAGWGVAVVCGAGMNCVGVAPDGRHARFPALGWITGDWGDGGDVGRAAVAAAARSEDGRGPKTTLEQAVPAFFHLRTPTQLAEAIHFGRIDRARAMELAPTVFAEAAHDEVAASIVARLTAEIVALARVAITRLGLEGHAVEVLLGGGLLRNGHAALLDGVASGLAGLGGAFAVRAASAAPVLGAALLALDELAAPREAYDRIRLALEGAGVG